MQSNPSKIFFTKKAAKFKLLFSILVAGVLLGVFSHVFADGTDVLSGTTGDATATISNSGKKWLYLIEGVASLFTYIKTKNVFVLGGVAVVAIMINIILNLSK